MDHSYSTKRERLQKVDHCYFSIGKKTPKVVLRKAEVLKNSQKNNKLFGEDHSYHKVNTFDRHSEDIVNQPQVNIQKVPLKNKSRFAQHFSPSLALRVIKSQSDKAEKMIFYVNYCSQSGRKLRIKRTIKKSLKNTPKKIRKSLAHVPKINDVNQKDSDHSYFSRKYRRTKSLPVINSFNKNVLNSSMAPLSPSLPVSSELSMPLYLTSPLALSNCITSTITQSLNDNIGYFHEKDIENMDVGNIEISENLEDITRINNILSIIPSQHDHSYLKPLNKAQRTH